jgi:hypothetical protein
VPRDVGIQTCADDVAEPTAACWLAGRCAGRASGSRAHARLCRGGASGGGSCRGSCPIRMRDRLLGCRHRARGCERGAVAAADCDGGRDFLVVYGAVAGGDRRAESDFGIDFEASDLPQSSTAPILRISFDQTAPAKQRTHTRDRPDRAPADDTRGGRPPRNAIGGCGSRRAASHVRDGAVEMHGWSASVVSTWPRRVGSGHSERARSHGVSDRVTERTAHLCPLCGEVRVSLCRVVVYAPLAAALRGRACLGVHAAFRLIPTRGRFAVLNPCGD